MSSLFGGGKPKPDAAMQRAQRRQDRSLSQQERDERAELGARQRLMAARAKGRGPLTLFAPTGAAGVTNSTLG